MKLPIRVEGGDKRILSHEGNVVAEVNGGLMVAGPMVLATNAYPKLVELLKGFIAGEEKHAEAKKFLAYLGEGVLV